MALAQTWATRAYCWEHWARPNEGLLEEEDGVGVVDLCEWGVLHGGREGQEEQVHPVHQVHQEEEDRLDQHHKVCTTRPVPWLATTAPKNMESSMRTSTRS